MGGLNPRYPGIRDVGIGADRWRIADSESSYATIPNPIPVDV